MITTYKEPDSYEPVFCDRKCDKCELQLSLDGATEYQAVGVKKLLADYNDALSLVPQDNERMEKREHVEG